MGLNHFEKTGITKVQIKIGMSIAIAIGFVFLILFIPGGAWAQGPEAAPPRLKRWKKQSRWQWQCSTIVRLRRRRFFAPRTFFFLTNFSKPSGAMFFWNHVFWSRVAREAFRNGRSDRCDRFWQICVQIGTILAIFRRFEIFRAVWTNRSVDVCFSKHYRTLNSQCPLFGLHWNKNVTKF